MSWKSKEGREKERGVRDKKEGLEGRRESTRLSLRKVFHCFTEKETEHREVRESKSRKPRGRNLTRKGDK